MKCKLFGNKALIYYFFLSRFSNFWHYFTDQSAEELRKEKEQKKKTLIRKVCNSLFCVRISYMGFLFWKAKCNFHCGLNIVSWVWGNVVKPKTFNKIKFSGNYAREFNFSLKTWGSIFALKFEMACLCWTIAYYLNTW